MTLNILLCFLQLWDGMIKSRGDIISYFKISEKDYWDKYGSNRSLIPLPLIKDVATNYSIRNLIFNSTDIK